MTSFVRVHSLKLHSCGNAGTVAPSSLYSLEVQEQLNQTPRTISRVYIPKELVAWFEQAHSGEIRDFGFHIEALSAGSAPQRMLKGEPQHLVLGVKSADLLLGQVPVPLRRARNSVMLVGVAAVFCGLLSLASSSAWVGAISLLVGTHLLRSGWYWPSRPFKGTGLEHLYH